jgi:hypothetical protein
MRSQQSIEKEIERLEKILSAEEDKLKPKEHTSRGHSAQVHRQAALLWALEDDD